MPDALVPTAAISASEWRGQDLSIVAAPPGVIVHLEGLHRAPPDAAQTFDEPPQQRRCAPYAGGTALSIGPETFLWLGREQPSDRLCRRFKAAIDVSGAWLAITVMGANAVPLLRKGCVLDLHPRKFAAGSCAATGMAGMRVVLWKPGPSASYGLLVSRSYAASFWDWLVEAAAEFQSDLTNG